MNALSILLCLICQALIVVGQVSLKRGMAPVKGTFKSRPFVFGIVCMAAWFFLWLGLMSKWDLSKLYPFEGLNPAMMALAAWIFLKERLPAGAWVGIGMVCAGIGLVAMN